MAVVFQTNSIIYNALRAPTLVLLVSRMTPSEPTELQKTAESAAQAGTRIGPYKLLQRLGEGGGGE